MDISDEYIVESEKYLAEDETLGECNNGTRLGNEEETKTCVHHWLIDAPRGNKSSGTCKLCGEVRKDYFTNSAEFTAWQNPGGPKKRVARNKKREEEDKRTGLNEISDSDFI